MSLKIRQSFKGLLDASGMTLVETMVTLGIASVMMMGILDLVQVANKSGRNVALNSDWTNVISAMRLALSSDTSCRELLGVGMSGASRGYTYNGTAPLVLPAAGLIYPSNDPVVQTPGNYNGFTVDRLSIVPVPGAPAQSIVLHDSATNTDRFYNMWDVQISPTGQKRVAAGMNIGSPTLRAPEPIVFKIITGPDHDTGQPQGSLPATMNNVFSCFGDMSVLPAACAMLGGQYRDPADPLSGYRTDETPCIIPHIRFLGSRANAAAVPNWSGPAGAVLSPDGGQRIQIWGTSPNSAPDDYGIGVNGGRFWMNVSGPAVDHFTGGVDNDAVDKGEFTWFYTAPGTVAANQQRALMALDNGANLIINPANTLGAGGRIAFGTNISNVGASPGEFITSNRSGAYSRAGNPSGEDLEFHTRSALRFSIDNTGEVTVGNRDNGMARLSFGTNGTTSGEYLQSDRAAGAGFRRMDFHQGTVDAVTGQSPIGFSVAANGIYVPARDIGGLSQSVLDFGATAGTRSLYSIEAGHYNSTMNISSPGSVIIEANAGSVDNPSIAVFASGATRGLSVNYGGLEVHERGVRSKILFDMAFGGQGGNVPFGCRLASQAGPQVNCSVGEIAVGGGGENDDCGNLFHSAENKPIQVGAIWGWRYGNTCGAKNTYAICCKY